MTLRSITCVAAVLLGVLALSSAASAGGPAAQDSTNGGELKINPDDVRQKNASDADARDEDAAADLESTRAALDRRSGPAVSVGVSGWVGEQVVRTH